VVAALIADVHVVALHARLAKHRSAIPRTTAGIAHTVLLPLNLVINFITPATKKSQSTPL